MFTNVLWATDGSEHADRAFNYAVRIAKENGATLHAVHVVEHLVGARPVGQPARVDEPALDERIERQIAESDRAEQMHSTLHMVSGERGRVAERITDIATDNDIDLIVIGTRGRSAVLGALIGSVAQQLLHSAPCPVLTVSPKVRDSVTRAPATLNARS
jgi:nucleotide-binding universal stress UspA family protein